ncbi:MAG: hypothetical protein IH624_04940 [Phycisphaerae bacterium]|nr:hypothetical protein [Phycisphaerae bacterium]
MSEVERLNLVRDYWKHADAGLRDERERMQTGFNFYVGNQWDAADLEKLAAEKRPALTINLILPIINLLAGIQRQGRQDITVAARRGGLARLAEVFTETLRHCMDVTDADYEIADCFLDGIIGNKGWIGVGVDYSDDPLGGDLKVSKVSPFDMREDPDAREYDLNRSGRFVIRDMWMDKEAVKLNWPGKVGDIDAGGLDVDPQSSDVAGGADAGVLRYRVRECWWKAFEKRIVLINAATGVMRVVDPAQAELAAAIAAQSGRWTVKEWVAPVLNKTVTAGNVVLEDVRDPYSGVTAFPYYRFCPYWVDGYVMGVVQNLQGPQQEVNKRRSQALHNLNQTANAGFKVKKVLNNYDRHLAKHGATPGVVLDESKAGGKIERIEPAPLSQGHITAAQMSAGDMKEISGANPDLLGHVMEGILESGKAIELRQAQGMKVVEVVFDNFSRTQKLLALGLVDMIRFTDVYSDAEIRAIAAEKLGTAELALLRSRKVGKYGIKIASSSTSPTARYANFMSIMEIARMYPEQIPAAVVVENSDLLNKEKILHDIAGRSCGDGAGEGRRGTDGSGKRLQVSRGAVNTLSRPQGRVG